MIMQPSTVRKWFYISTILSVVLLWMASWQATRQWHAKVSTDSELKSLRMQANAYDELLKQHRLVEQLGMNAQHVSTLLQHKKISDDHWESRIINIENALLERDKVQEYLFELRSQPNSLFVPEYIMLKAENKEDSLFSWSPGDDENLLITLKGAHYLRDTL